jgi:hypothetical protein
MNDNKFINAVLTILKARPGLGSLQLRKALVIADALHNCLHGESITGTKYIKNKYGPVPDNSAFVLLRRMNTPLGLVAIKDEDSGHCTKKSYYNIAEPDYSLFSKSAIDILNYAAGIVSKYPANILSNMTHDDNYNNTPMNAEISLDSVCKMTITGYDTEPFTEAEKYDARRFLQSDEAKMYSFV